MHKAALLPLRSGIWEGQPTHVPHRRYLEVLPFVNTHSLVALLMVAAPVRMAIPTPAIPVVVAPVPMAIPMVIPTPATQTEVTTVAINEARVVASILKVQAQIHAI